MMRLKPNGGALDLVEQMREAQKRATRMRTPDALAEARALETTVDACLAARQERLITTGRTSIWKEILWKKKT
jgi:hypothetical protein